MVDKTDDAIALWQQMVGEMQKGFRAFGDQFSRESSEPMPDSSEAAQKRMAELMESYFAGMNLPSRAQLHALSDRLRAIENELTDIKALLHEALMNSRPVRDDAPKAARSVKRPAQAKGQKVPAGKSVPVVPGDDNKSG